MSKRLEILKTYKIYIGGKFPRTESGRYYQPQPNGKPLGNICLSSRKDFRNAVVAARNAFEGWSSRAAFNRSQIIYRIAEIIEGRKEQFIQELIVQGSTKTNAIKEVDLSIDRLVYFAGWCDKINQVFGSVNPVSSSHFNFTSLEPMGVVAIMAPKESSLLGLISTLVPVIASGNTCVVISSENYPLCAVTLSEVLSTSDVPGGVVNILTGKRKELIEHVGSHMDVNAVLYADSDNDEIKKLQILAVDNLKRIIRLKEHNWNSDEIENPYVISDFMESKTTWHPIEKISGTGTGY
jgi:acyl-CoA reductase-like NAD-dependent aldehyde dehydrogenase